MRFFVDHCVPAEVADFLRSENHDGWTAFEANLQEAADEDLLISSISVVEPKTVEAMARALEWMATNHLPAGRVLRVPLKAPLSVMTPLPMD